LAELRDRVDRVVSAVEDDTPDLAEVASLADAVGDFADTISGIYGDLEQTLMRGLRHQVEADDEAGSEAEEAGGEQRKQRRQQSKEHVSTEEEATKEELLEQARELNVHGRSSMGKEELAQAVEAEESLTKDDLLERAREAGVEGRSSMRKEELRDALREAGA